jgi:hypothetical protein
MRPCLSLLIWKPEDANRKGNPFLVIILRMLPKLYLEKAGAEWFGGADEQWPCGDLARRML